MSEQHSAAQVKAVAAGLQRTSGRAAAPGSEHRNLDVFIGKWINVGHTVATSATSEVPSTKILTSDIYEWAPGGFFVIHSAYGLIGDFAVGGVEIISYDPDAGHYRSQFFDSQGNTTISQLSLADGVWTWAGPRTRCTATFSDDGRIQTAHHQASKDGMTWQPSMEVTLHKTA
jgi:hypothetical protein